MQGNGRVLIVGAGIAGLTLANGLQADFDVVVIEAAATLQPAGLGLAIMPNGTRALEKLGLADAIRSRALRMERAITLGPDGREIAVADFARQAGAFGDTLGVHRTALLAGLTERLRVDVRLATRVTALQQADDHVQVEFNDGETAEFDLVIAADGLRSQLGPMLFGDEALAYRGYRAWRTLLPREASDPTDTCFRLGPGRYSGHFPVDSSWMYLFVLEHGPDEAGFATSGLEQLQRIGSEHGSFINDLAARASEGTPVLYTPVYEVLREEWVRGRAGLIGDAAHAIVPFFAQGAAMAIEDAVVLSEEMRANSGPAGLEAYHRRRRPRLQTVRDICRFFGMSVGMEGRVSRNELAAHPGAAGDAIQRSRTLWAGLEG